MRAAVGHRLRRRAAPSPSAGISGARVHSRPRTRVPVNPNLARLQSYPFEKLRALFAGIEPPAHLKPDPAVDRRAAASDPRLHPPDPGRQPRRPVELPGHAGQRCAARRDRTLARAPLRPAEDRPRQPGDPGRGHARGAVRLRAVRGRWQQARRQGAVPEPVLPDLRRRGPAGQRRADLHQQPARERLRLGLRRHRRGHLAGACSSSTCARRATPPAGC